MCNKDKAICNVSEQDYMIEVSETLSRTYIVRAASLEEAQKKVRSAYDLEHIILSGDDCIESNIFPSPFGEADSVLPNDIDITEYGYLRLED